MKRWSWVVVLLWACGGTGSNAGQDVRDVKLDSADPGKAEVDEDLPPDAEEAIEEVVDDAATDVPVEDVPPKPGEAGYPCDENTQCNSGVCLDTPAGKVCAQACLESCPAGYACKNLTIGSDIFPVCTPLFLLLCDPCSENKDCNTDATGGSAACVDRGPAGRFCGGDCGSSNCPPGYACEEVPDPQGAKSKQCVPASGAECACSARAIKTGLTTECYLKNDAGTCKGSRKCIVSGLTACDAAEPKKESCNGVDDDCNSLTDENLGTEIECEKHATIDGKDHVCKGKGECITGAIVNCDAKTPVPESCNGQDDDCNGLTDDAICDDGNACTKDYCNVGDGSCTYQPQAGAACDDGNPCTMNDHCDDQRNCLGGSQKNCDDGNVCTDDYCDTGNGDCKHNNNTAPCEDKDKCTVGDKCLNGTCMSGKVKDCSENNPCRTDFQCVPATGNCSWKATNDGQLCTDQDDCTTATKCHNGECGGGADVCELKDCPVPPGKTFCAAPACSILGAPLGLLCICACL